MKAEEAMFVWTPNRKPFDKYPSAGTVAVTNIPENPKLKQHPISVGACDLGWREADAAGRIELMEGYIRQMIDQDHVDPASVRAALADVDEFRNYPFKL